VLAVNFVMLSEVCRLTSHSLVSGHIWRVIRNLELCRAAVQQNKHSVPAFGLQDFNELFNILLNVSEMQSKIIVLSRKI